MDILYEEGEGVVFKETVAWLKAPSEQLQMSGALAVGNFARNGQYQIIFKWCIVIKIIIHR